jgi:single-strand DNA-binding protein
MNKVILSGRLTKDPELKHSGVGDKKISYVRFSLACDRKRSLENDADFISCIAFNKKAEFICKCFKKGARILIDGRLQTGKYEKDGNTYYTTDVLVESVEFADGKIESNQDDIPEDKFIEVSDEELPFK